MYEIPLMWYIYTSNMVCFYEFDKMVIRMKKSTFS